MTEQGREDPGGWSCCAAQGWAFTGEQKRCVRATVIGFYQTSIPNQGERPLPRPHICPAFSSPPCPPAEHLGSDDDSYFSSHHGLSLPASSSSSFSARPAGAW